jgi:hypothetical protein
VPEDFSEEELSTIRKYQASIETEQFKKAQTAMAVFEAAPTQENLEAMRAETKRRNGLVTKKKTFLGGQRETRLLS